MATLLNRRRYMGGVAKAKPYLKFTALEDGTFQFVQAQEYSIDDGKTWTSLAAATATPTISAGSTIMWKGTYTPANAQNKFSSTGLFNVEGDPRSVFAGDSFETTTLPNNAFNSLFRDCTKLVDASGLQMSFTSVSGNCCADMFRGCTSLTTAPSLPTMSLNNSCYVRMFYGCSALTTAPSILPATTLAISCYEQMFRGCSNLTTAPILPALTLVRTCYYYMFAACSKLNFIKALFTTDPSSVNNSISQWVQNVASSGTFVKNSSATWTNTGASGVPTGWTIEYETP